MKRVFRILVLLPLLIGGLLFAKSIDEVFIQIEKHRTQLEERIMGIRIYHFIWEQGYIEQGTIRIPLSPTLKDSIKKEIKNYLQLIKADMDSCKMWMDSLACKLK